MYLAQALKPDEESSAMPGLTVTGAPQAVNVFSIPPVLVDDCNYRRRGERATYRMWWFRCVESKQLADLNCRSDQSLDWTLSSLTGLARALEALTADQCLR